MSCVSRHQGRTAWCLPARDRGSGDGGDCVQGTCGRRFVKGSGDNPRPVPGHVHFPEMCHWCREGPNSNMELGQWRVLLSWLL